MSRGDHNDSNGLHPLAKHLWLQVDGLSEIDRRYVHSFLQRRLTPEMQLPNQEIAIAALQRFDSARRATATATPGGEPAWARGTVSKRNYNAFRDSQPDRNSWPSTTLIANAFDRRWSDALAAAGLAAAPNVLAGRGLRQGKPFDVEEVTGCLVEWIAQVDPGRPLFQSEYVAWANRNQASSGRRPPTLPTVAKYLGGWDAVLIELGVLERHPDVVAARRRLEDNTRAGWATDVVMALDLESLPRPAAGGPGFEQCAEWLRWMTAPLSEEARAGLEMEEWDILRAALTVRLAGGGTHTTVPSAKGIKDKADDRSWPAAKLQAGIVDEAFSGRCSPTTRAFDDDELIEALASAAAAIGHLPSRAEYAEYRRTTSAEGRRLPSDASIRMRLGTSNTWESALDQLATERLEIRMGSDVT